MIIDRKKVIAMPSNNVVPTVRIGLIGTKEVQVRTLKPMMVVSADSIIAFPVVQAAFTVA
tara:strand:- start:4 stop:183 length:180 start_codon:yes stop_codon:yes gene_type:complete